MPVRSSICLLICVSVCLAVCLFVYLFIWLSGRLCGSGCLACIPFLHIRTHDFFAETGCFLLPEYVPDTNSLRLHRRLGTRSVMNGDAVDAFWGGFVRLL